ncbi:MAG: immunity protein 19 [Acetatifactor sp.]|nr:immunity protein 19 [Acetatifactor sp.]
MDRVRIEEIYFDNKPFWRGYFLIGYSECYCEELDMSIWDMEEEIIQAGDWEYWNEFTGWYEGIIDECDGYLDEPTYLEVYIGTMDKTLKIEFHPGDTYYYLDGAEIGNIGPHSMTLQPLSFHTIKSLLDNKNGDILFFLLFPMIDLEEENRAEACKLFQDRLIAAAIFDGELCEKLVRMVFS